MGLAGNTMLQKKMGIPEYIRTEFTPNSRPHPTTVIRQIERGDLNGVKIGGRWYVIKDMSTGDPLADEILSRRHAAT